MEDLFREEDFVKKGKMKKLPFDMTPEENKVWKKEISEDIRTYLFSIGQPLVYKKNGQVIAEHADGTIEVVDKNA